MFRISAALISFFAFLLGAPVIALAQAAPGAPSAFQSLVPIIFMIVVMWFLIIRPQQKRQKDHQAFLTALKRGDQVLTSGGILGTIEGLTDQYVTLEIAPEVRVKILRGQIASAMPTAGTEVKA